MTKFDDAVGWSKLDTYRTCPRKFKYQFIDKLPQPSSPALERGSRMHDELECYLKGWGGLPEWAGSWGEPLKALKAQPTLQSELALGFNKDWTLRENWFGRDCYLRVKMDAYYFGEKELVAVDFKSGRYRVPSDEQVELYGAAGLELAPHVETVRLEYWYLDTEETHSRTFTKAQTLEFRPKFDKEFQKIYTETQWKATPSRECRWCPYSKSKGGPCDF